MNRKSLKSDAGISMIEVLVALGVMALVIPFALKMFFNTRQAQVSNETRLNLRSVARTIENLVDCPNVPKACNDGQLVAIPRRMGGTLIAADGKTVFSTFTIRALCTGSNLFQVQAMKAGKEVAVLFPEKTLCASQPPPILQQTGDLIEVKAGTGCAVSAANLLPCNPPLPPPCDAGYTSRGMSLDTFGGSDDTEVVNVFGQRWMRYCERNPP